MLIKLNLSQISKKKFLEDKASHFIFIPVLEINFYFFLHGKIFGGTNNFIFNDLFQNFLKFVNVETQYMLYQLNVCRSKKLYPLKQANFSQ